MTKFSSLMVFVVLLTACASEQDKTSFWKVGYSVTRIQNDIFKVTLRDESYAGPGIPNEVVLSRCAAVAMENGYRYFTFLDERSLVIKCYKEKPSEVQTAVYDGEQLKPPPQEAPR